MNSLLSLQNVSKSLGFHFWQKKKDVLKDISLNIESNEIMGLVGHNGAGKTTLFKIIVGFMKADRGAVHFSSHFGQDPRFRIGFLPESPYFYSHLSARECLGLYISLFGMSLKDSTILIENSLNEVGLQDHSNALLRSYSKGMLQRFGIAQALLNDPELLILDEPMSGLDPEGRRDMRSVIMNRAERGKAVVFSSHILSDVEDICDRVVVLKGGEIVQILSNEETNRYRSWIVEFRGEIPRHDLQMPMFKSAQTLKHGGYRLTLSTIDDVNMVLKVIINSGGRIEDVKEMYSSLETLLLPGECKR
ncbi:ABC transporter ATP-binding protein [Desulfoluna sp.]|uniref:ABC transporter ATP-binding protein n=1 Tax=Desulfoluna sp. TaxID=2045199 RepID=UPI002614C578|nr:ABC transporter ATP-binding protein [Desulfoluna sp.]